MCLLAGVFLGVVLPSAHVSGQPTMNVVPVRVFDLSGQRDLDRQVALDAAAAMLAQAGVEIQWKICLAGDSQNECGSRGPEGERFIRITPSPSKWPLSTTVPLGEAFIDTLAGTGVLANVYSDRVSWMASRAGTNEWILLGRAIAHELGHLLLGTSKHSTAGVMRAVWTPLEMQLDRSCDWSFTSGEVAMLSATRRTP